MNDLQGFFAGIGEAISARRIRDAELFSADFSDTFALLEIRKHKNF